MKRLRTSAAVAGIFGLLVLSVVLALNMPEKPFHGHADAHPAGPSAGSVQSAATSKAAGQIRSIDARSGPIYSLAFSPDGQLLATGGADETVRIWNAATGQQLYSLKGHDSAVTSVAFSPDGKKLASAGGLRHRGLLLWNVRDGTPDKPPLEPFDGWVSAVKFSSDGKSLLAAVGLGLRGKGIVGWWDLANRKKKRGRDGYPLTYRTNDGIGSIAISPNRRYVVIANHAMSLWDTKTNHERKSFDEQRQTPLFIRQAVFTHGGRGILAGGMSGALRMWDVDSGAEIRRFAGHAEEICALCLLPDDRLAVSSAFDNTIRLWDTASGRELRQFIGHQGIAWALDVSPKDFVVASAGEDGTIRFWSTALENLDHPAPNGGTAAGAD